jgi:hypothetical protein
MKENFEDKKGHNQAKIPPGVLETNTLWRLQYRRWYSLLKKEIHPYVQRTIYKILYDSEEGEKNTLTLYQLFLKNNHFC